jgi:hypothetical protein
VNFRKFIGVAATLVAILALGAAWYFFREIQAAERGRISLTASLERTRERTRAEAAARGRQSGAGRDGQSADHAGGPAGAAPRPGAPTVAALLAADPKLMVLYLKNFRAQLPDLYGFEYARLGLSPAQIDKFEELTTAHEGETMDLRAAAQAQGLPANDPGIAAMRKQSDRQYQLAVLSLAGISAVQAQNDQRMASGQMETILANVASLTAVGPAPMTYAQAGQLAPILAAASPSFQSGGQVQLGTMDWDKAIAQAAGVLSGPQLDSLKMQAVAARATVLAKEFHDQQHPTAAP